MNRKCFNSLKNNIWESSAGGLDAKNDCSGEVGGKSLMACIHHLA